MKDSYDAIVIGAGPAGSLAARQIARQGVSVLLVDKASFPRDKVCGCCLNARSLAVLERVGLGDLVRRGEARPLHALQLYAGGRRAVLPLPQGVALSRRWLDAALVDAAAAEGVTFVDGASATLAHVEPGAHRVAIRGRSEVRARTVVVADGLGGRALRGAPGFEPRTARTARMGCGCTLAAAAPRPEVGLVHMAVGAAGYVGAVRLEDGRTDVAAALDVRSVKQLGGLAGAIAAIARDAGWAWADRLGDAAWHGTPRLTRRRGCIVRDGVFVVGDAAGYVEPFTGEGIAWALASGEAVADVAVAAARCWRPRLALQWTRLHARVVRRRQHTCRALAWALRRPRLTAAAVGILARRPRLAAPVLRRLTHAGEAVA